MIPSPVELCWRGVPSIHLDGKPGEPARFAASELRRYLTQIFESNSVPESKVHLCVDSSAGLSDEGYSWYSEGTVVHLIAGGELGLVFGVYAFLRNVCGCLFCGLGPDGEFIPQLSELRHSGAVIRREPKLWYRSIQFYYFDSPLLLQQVIDWMAKNGYNYVHYHLGTRFDEAVMSEQRDPKTGELVFPTALGLSMFDEDFFNRHLLPEIHRRGLKLDFNNHNFCYWLPPAKYAREHPEWYAEIDGKRATQFHQLCFCTSNTGMVSELIRRVKEFLRAHPDVRIVGIIPEDGLGMCQCETCRALDVNPDDAFISGRDYRDPANENRSITRRYAKLLNSVARVIRDEFPGVLVGGIAYVDLRWPPRDVVLEDNIMMQVAIYWRDGARPLAAKETSSTNRNFFDLLKQWRRHLRAPLLLNEYYEGMQAQRSLPYPMVDVIAEDWQNLAALPVDGATIQCTAGCQEAYALNMLAFSKCAWGEPVDSDRLLDEYVLSVFGNAGSSLRPIFRSMLDGVNQWREGGKELLPEGTNIDFFWKYVGVDRVAAAIEQARKSATTDRERRQIELFASYLRYCELAAQAMGVSLRIRQMENSGATAARRLREKLACHDLPAVIQYLEQTKVTGWILPRAITRWKNDLKATKQKLQAVQVK